VRILLPAQDRMLLSCPVRLPLGDRVLEQRYWRLLPEDGSPAVVGEVVEEEGGPALLWVVHWLPPGRARHYRLEAFPEVEYTRHAGVEVRPAGPTAVEVSVAGAPLTTYHYGPDVVRPYFYPLIGPYRHSLTRHFPMRTDVPGETHDHPHHRSLWVAHGDVNGVDNWSEGKGHGRILLRGTPRLASGPAVGMLEAEHDWVSAEGRRLCEEFRRVTFYASGWGVRLADVELRFRASEGDLRFGDTKEGGLLSVRVAESMKGAAGGHIANGIGGRGEAECWGKRGPWCDYSGLVESDVVGLAIFDQRTNFRYPTYWHVREYGLMTANPFGLSHFLNDRTRDGSLLVPAGSVLTFRYRLHCHAGDARAARVDEQFLNYAFPPEPQWTEER
jgi:hypothetical protein